MPKPTYVAAIDQGTTSTRCTLYDAESRPVATARREHRQRFPRPGWVEHDAAEILANTLAAAREAAAAAPPGRIAALGITNQRETTVVWDRLSGEPVHPAIVWQDVRTAEACEWLAADGGADVFRERTGLHPATYFAGPKISWIVDQDRSFTAGAEDGRLLAGTIDSWLVWNLTGGVEGGVHVTDVTNASRTMLMDLRTLDWDGELCDFVAVPRPMLPRIVASSEPGGWGTTRRGAPFADAVPVCGILGDQQAALFGQGCLDAGSAKCTYGTGAFVLVNTGPEPVASRSGLLTTVAYRLGAAPARYALEGSIAMAGSLVQWLRDALGLFERSAEIEALAREVEDTGGVHLVPAFSGLFAPRWRPDARGTIVGLTGHSDKRHLARAALEATAFQVRDVLEAMRADAPLDLDALRVDGGMAANDLLLQTQADLLGLPVVRPRELETTSLGAAWAAGLAADVWPSPEELASTWQAERTFEPAIDAAEREARSKDWDRAVERSLGWAR